MVLMLYARFWGYLFPAWLLLVAAYASILVFFDLLLLRGVSDVLRPSKLSKRVFGKTWLLISSSIKKREDESPLPDLDRQAYGRVLEVGPGSGNQLSRYDKSKLEKVYGLEPNEELHGALAKTISAEGLDGVYQLVAGGIEDAGKLEGYGIKEGSMDTVVCVSVMCSVPEPQKMAQKMYKMLKPGGQLLVHEHVASTDTVSGFMQDLYELVWPHAFGNCHLRRPTGHYLAAAGKWEKIEFEAPKPEDACSIIPKVIGRMIKSSNEDGSGSSEIRSRY